MAHTLVKKPSKVIGSLFTSLLVLIFSPCCNYLHILSTIFSLAVLEIGKFPTLYNSLVEEPLLFPSILVLQMFLGVQAVLRNSSRFILIYITYKTQMTLILL